MAKKNDTRFFENKLLDFVAAKDPLLEMLQWMMDKFMECLEEGFEDSVQFYAFEKLDGRKISRTNILERLNREIRLITSYLLEYSDDWQTERCYINAGSIKLQKEILFDAA